MKRNWKKSFLSCGRLMWITTILLITVRVCFCGEGQDTLEAAEILDQKAVQMIRRAELLQTLDALDGPAEEKICRFATRYARTEWIKTKVYQTPFHDDIAFSLRNLAKLYTYCHPPMAREYLLAAIKIRERVHSKQSEPTAQAHDAFGDYLRLYMMGFKEAIDHYETARQIRTALYGKNDSRITTNFSALAITLYYHESDKDTAERLFQESLRLREKSGQNQPQLLQALIDAADFYYLIQENGKAAALLTRALKMAGQQSGTVEIDILEKLGMLSLTRNRINEALTYSKSAYMKAKRIYLKEKSPVFLGAIEQLTAVVTALNDEALIKKLEAEKASVRQELLKGT